MATKGRAIRPYVAFSQRLVETRADLARSGSSWGFDPLVYTWVFANLSRASRGQRCRSSL